MECKWDSLWSEKSQEDELIDTLWNVNYSLKEILHNPV